MKHPDTNQSGFSTFLPTIISGLGKWTAAETQLLTVPCYFFGAATYMCIAVLSDRLQMRGLFCLIFGTVSIIGYAVLLADMSTAVHYFACFLVAGGLYVVVGLPLAWVCPLHLPPLFIHSLLTKPMQMPNNSPRYGKRTTATGMQLTMGNAAGIMSAFI